MRNTKVRKTPQALTKLRVEGHWEPELGRIACIFPNATTIHLSHGNHTEQLVAALAVLPDGAWPKAQALANHVYSVDDDADFPASVIVHAARLCPRLRELSVCCSKAGEGAALAAGLEGMAAVAGTLEALHISLDSDEGFEPGKAPRAAAALARLGGLRRLQIYWSIYKPPYTEDLLAMALSSLTALSSLRVDCCDDYMPSDQQLGVCPDALRELSLLARSHPWALQLLNVSQQLDKVTRLELSGCVSNIACMDMGSTRMQSPCLMHNSS